MENKKFKLNTKKVLLNTILFCSIIIVATVMYFQTKDALQTDTTSYAITNDEKTDPQVKGTHIRYITNETVKELDNTSDWNTDKEKEKILKETLNKDTSKIKSYTVEGSKE